MILTVTLNTAVDVTCHVDEVRPHSSHRVRGVTRRAGGKGVNVARVLHALGHDVVATGLAGGPDGRFLRTDLARSGVAAALVAVGGHTRRTLTVVDADATVFNEPGPQVAPAEWRAFLTTYESLLARARLVVLSGSLPPGVPDDAYAVLGERADRAEVPIVLDSDGAPLLLGLAGGPAIVKPNADELARLVPDTEPHEAARTLRAAGAKAVVASLGPEGLLATTGTGDWRACPAQRVAGNPTGAGDAAVAALAAGLVAGQNWPELLTHAVALSAAAVLTSTAGGFDADAYRRFLPRIRIEAC